MHKFTVSCSNCHADNPKFPRDWHRAKQAPQEDQASPGVRPHGYQRLMYFRSPKGSPRSKIPPLAWQPIGIGHRLFEFPNDVVRFASERRGRRRIT